MSIGPTRTAVGAWSGGRFMRFGVEVDEQRLVDLLTPDADIGTVITADVYGNGAADKLVGQAVSGAGDHCLVGAIGHDFYTGSRQGAKGYPRFTDPTLRGEDDYADYLRMATERSLERIGVDRFDLLMLHNPDRIGYTSEVVWQGMVALKEAGLTDSLGVAPGPANGFTLDMIDCFDRFGDVIDWAMVILNPFEPWPSDLVLPAAERADIKLITRVVDFGGIFHDDVAPGHDFPEHDHRQFRPTGWVEAANDRLEKVREIADRHGLTPLQLACMWNLSLPAVECVVPTLIEEAATTKPIEQKRAELAALPTTNPLSIDDVAAVREIGDNTGCMVLKGGSPDNDGGAHPDNWPIDERLAELAAEWNIDIANQLAKQMPVEGPT